jgi:G:T-mismatch repair DNA endonuclease (very short patch repair protein)
MAEPEIVSQLRSRNMAAIRGKDTTPEVAVRRSAFKPGELITPADVSVLDGLNLSSA